MAAHRVVGLGLCVVDHFYRVEAAGRDATRVRYDERLVTAGGHIANALRQVAALGCRARALSALGDDADARIVLRALRESGVDTRGVVLSPRLRTTVAVVMVDRRSGERRFLVPDRRGLEAAAPELDLAAIDARSLLLVDGHFPEQALRAVQRARARGARVVGDFHRLTPGVRRLLPWVDHAIVSEELVAGAGFESTTAALRWLAERTRDRPAVTQGARGGAWLDGRRVRRWAPHRARVVDTTGAGDVFHGAFAAGLCLGLGFEASLDLAARAAARNCSALGGAGRLTTRDELPAFRSGRAARPSPRSRRGR